MLWQMRLLGRFDLLVVTPYSWLEGQIYLINEPRKVKLDGQNIRYDIALWTLNSSSILPLCSDCQPR